MQTVLTPKQLAKITGQVSSMPLAIGPLVHLFTKNMYHKIENRTSWYEPKIISRKIYNGYTFEPRTLKICLIFTDTSDEGY